ncbi:flagellar hook-associated protein FlgK [Pseudoroseicyclus aestuarii]|uniref:Flagellar hook-associated protein 1 n=1 Tax=Pseudoroseicyclus aestuarii TaxID=1795041 RepID=A0A318SSL9_9RHOB|nr:flagellar hook-associated protein FlgK [Pseudoroseicyclus aestuarii]PYE84375.1 flagellar hook-associated protein 1 FlgK [Pseudoroseicyclus aestuarii]
MSLTGALLSSRSGLSAAAARSQTVAGNIANAGTDGYVRRSTIVTSRQLGGGAGVEVTAIRRDADAALDRLHRLAMSRQATQDAASATLVPYAAMLGDPGDAGTLSADLTALQTAFDTLSVTPASSAQQLAVLDAAQGLAGQLNGLAGSLSQAAEDARGAVARDVDRANGLLSQIAALNDRLAADTSPTASRAALGDEMDAALDALAPLMAFSASTGADGRVTLRTSGGAALVEGGEAQTLAYTPATGRLTAGGVDITPSEAGSRGASEGSIAGRLTLLSDDMPRLQAQLDETARVLIEGFAAADASLAPGQQGLFVDTGGAGSDSQGLAGRIGVNASVDPERGGALWRIRDGAGAQTEGAASDGTQIAAFIGVLEADHTVDPAAGLGARLGLPALAAGVMTDAQGLKARAAEAASAAAVTTAAMGSSREAAEGVSIDDQLGQLLEIEQSYAANSKVLTSVAEMIDTLLAAV